ncbi:MAG: hypothetical protein ACPGES_01175 [Coraliomargarita sp.]
MNQPLRIAIVHYHLKRGGVTRVIESTLRGFSQLAEAPKCIVLAGEVPDDVNFRAQAVEVQGLQYSNAQVSTPSSQQLINALRKAAEQALGGPPDLWHIHNHSLGKNSSMPGIISLLAEQGEALLLHMHDFAEDGRPANYQLNQLDPDFSAKLYPSCPRVHYAVLNGRDEAIFQQCAVSRSQLHQLANPVEGTAVVNAHNDSAEILEALEAKRLILYPVRAVRRKNFGELLLWSALADPGDVFATTLGPTNKDYQAAYNDWRQFAAKHKLPVHFSIGEDNEWSFDAIMQAAHCICTTSIAEGFGLAFLEPALFGKAIVGRDLPQITADFKAHGVQLEHLYTHLGIPLDWIDLESLRSEIDRELRKSYTAYGVELPEGATQRALDVLIRNKTIDYSGLDETNQRTVIEKLIENPSLRDQLQLPDLVSETGMQSISANAQCIEQNYALPNYAQTLTALYQEISAAKNPESIDYFAPETVLNGFLKPESFRLLRT